MRFPFTSRRVTPLAKMIATCSVLFGLSVILLLSVQAASIYVVENDVDVGTYAMAVIDGKPVMAYYDNVTKTIRLAVCTNDACETGTTTITPILTVNNPVTVELTDIGGNPFIVYSDPTALQLKAIACSDPTCSAAPTITLVTNLLTYKSVVKDVTSIAGKPMIVFLDYLSVSQASLKTAACADLMCSQPATFSTLLTDDDSDWGQEYHAADSGGVPIISFLHERQLKLTVCADLTCSGSPAWRILDSEWQALDDGRYSYHGLIFINGNPAIAYLADNGHETRTVTCTDPTCSAEPFRAAFALWGLGVTATSINNRMVIAQTTISGEVSSLYLSTCADAACSSITTTTLPTSDYGKNTPRMINLGDYPAVAYLHSQDQVQRLSYYYHGDFTPAQPPTPSMVPSITPSPLPQPPPTLPSTARPVETVTPIPTLPTLSAPSATVEMDSAVNIRGLDMKLDHQGLPVIAYRSLDKIRLARCTTPGTCNPQVFPIATVSSYKDSIRLALDSSSTAFILYDDSNQLFLAACDSPTTCDTTDRRWLIDSGFIEHYTLALDNNGVPILAYTKYVSSSYGSNRLLRFARCESAASCAAPARFNTFDPMLGYLSTLAVAVDANNIPLLAYSDSILKTLHLTRCESATSCSAPTSNMVGAATGLVTLIMDGGVPLIGANMHDAYHGRLLYLVRCESALTCNTPTRTITDAVPAAPYNNQSFVALDSLRRPILVGTEGNTGMVRLIHCDSPLCAWPNRVILDGGGGFAARLPAIAIDGQDRVYVAYTRVVAGDSLSRLMLFMGSPANLPPASSSSAAPYRNLFTMRQPVLTWSAVTWAVGYEIQVDDSRDFRSPVKSDNTLPSPSFQATFANGTYWWRVRAKDAGGKWGAWSAAETFVVFAP